MKKIQTRTGLKASVKIPGSKSITHRALIAAALAEGESLLKNHLVCEDTLHTRAVLQELGVDISSEGGYLRVMGNGWTFFGIIQAKNLQPGEFRDLSSPASFRDRLGPRKIRGDRI